MHSYLVRLFAVELSLTSWLVQTTLVTSVVGAKELSLLGVVAVWYESAVRNSVIHRLFLNPKSISLIQ